MNEDGFRLAGQGLGLDLTAGLQGGSIENLRRAVRADKLIPRQSMIKDFYEIAPEHSQGVYDGTQPEYTFGV